ncbi:MAG TPA: hypothetical protein PLH41_16185, partial [Accumulibacter sp.]|uniref:hypothetical protein n=1 Tax=Accumulibacter sp. TaxID=2053492 RepID=UPI002C55C5BB
MARTVSEAVGAATACHLRHSLGDLARRAYSRRRRRKRFDFSRRKVCRPGSESDAQADCAANLALPLAY